jgi:uncharacterized membrane protein
VIKRKEEKSDPHSSLIAKTKNMKSNNLKSIGAVLAGMITIIGLSVGTDFVLESTGIFSPPDQGFLEPWMLAVALIYRCIYAVAGGYVTAALAPDRPMRHAIILGIIGIALSTIGAVVGWNLSAHWYPLALVLTALPCTWLGGKLFQNKSKNLHQNNSYA